MKAILDIKDNKVPFVMELFDNFSFVKIQSFTDSETLSLHKTNKIVNSCEKDIFAKVRGIWADRDINGKTLRNQA